MKPIMLICAKCGKTFWAKRANVVGVTNDRIFCSEKCHGEVKALKQLAQEGTGTDR